MGRRITNSFTVLMVAALAGMFVAGCSPSSLVSTSDEVAVGRQASAEVEAQYPVNRDPQINQLVNTIGRNLLAQTTPREGITYTFKVLDIQEMNAFALPGGWIYINKGLIDRTRNTPDQLAGVIAHEIGHVQAKHHAEMMGRSALYGIAIGTLTKGNTAQWASLFANINLLRWSRKHEYEADRWAVDLTLSSRYNAQGIIDFFNVLMAEQGRGSTPAFLRTHPLTEDRIARAQDYLNERRAATGQR